MGKDVPRETRTLVYPSEMGEPKAWLNFVQSTPFERAWKKLGMTDVSLRCLEIAIMMDPKGPPVIKGTGGVRKIRIAKEDTNKGKRGGARICYVYFEEYGIVFCMAAYAKQTKADLTPEEKDAMRMQIELIEKHLSCG